MKIGHIRILILFFLPAFGCTNYKSSDILLQIGQYKLSVEDYNLLRKYYNNNITSKLLNDKIIADGYILAYAIDNKFDTIDIISKKLRYAIYDKISKVDGYVWNIKVKPNLIISFDEIKNTYNKRIAQFSFEILFFPTENCLNKFLAIPPKIDSENKFNLLKKRVASIKEVKIFSIRDYYPFFPIGAYSNNILLMKRGDVLGPLETLSGYYVIQNTGIDTIKQPPLEEEKNKIEEMLLKTLTEKHIWESQKKITSQAEIKFNDNNILTIAPKYNDKRKEWVGTDKTMELMKYKYHDSIISYKISDLMEYITCAPLVYGSLSDQDVIKRCMKDYVIYLFLFDEALQLNINNDQEFLLFKKQFLEKLFLQYYHDISSKRLAYPKLKTLYSIKINHLKEYSQKLKN